MSGCLISTYHCYISVTVISYTPPIKLYLDITIGMGAYQYNIGVPWYIYLQMFLGY